MSQLTGSGNPADSTLLLRIAVNDAYSVIDHVLRNGEQGKQSRERLRHLRARLEQFVEPTEDKSRS